MEDYIIEHTPDYNNPDYDLTTFKKEKDWTKIRGQRIAMVFQDPMTSLNPLKTVGKQIQEAFTLHNKVSKAEAKARTLELLADVGIPEPEKRYKQYPHEFSGGMRQRVVIAIKSCRLNTALPSYTSRTTLAWLQTWPTVSP